MHWGSMHPAPPPSFLGVAIDNTVGTERSTVMEPPSAKRSRVNSWAQDAE